MQVFLGEAADVEFSVLKNKNKNKKQRKNG